MPEEICSQEETVILFFLQMLSELSKNEMRGIIRNSNTVQGRDQQQATEELES